MQFDTVSRLGRRPLPSKVHSLTTRRLQALPGARQARRARVGRALAFQDAHEQVSTERRHRMVADTSDEEGYLPSDADSDIPMNQRLSSRELYRQMKHLPPEYPTELEPEQDSPEKHMSVADLASDEDEMLPDDPRDLDEELITDTKPFIADVYNQMPGVLRKATTDDIARHRSAGHGSTNRPSGGASRLSTGEHEPESRERRMTEAEEDVTEMKPTSGTGGAASPAEAAGQGPTNRPSGGASRLSTGEREPEGRERRMTEAEEEVTEMKPASGTGGVASPAEAASEGKGGHEQSGEQRNYEQKPEQSGDAEEHPGSSRYSG
ncbi:hypothetical protein D9Q98_006873 [Chlorella vulgaris]|uniref:Uncharacterized protein n=1 Tax=Chlorella vulgaris TaxID=3077 RepID=A0A9D4TJ62_CHLVU|nr:hypothetical protein D9Q98_006873 [Chlorella vulgaris]